MTDNTSSFQKLPASTLGDRASSAILQHIRTEKLQPGSPLPSEARLADMLGVSRPVIREAMRTLRGLGVLQIFNGRGAVVGELSPNTLEVFFSHALQTVDNSYISLMELRSGLECQAAALAAARHGPKDEALLRDLIAEMAKAQDNPAAYSQLDADLHIAIARASDNQLLLFMVQSIRSAMREASLRGMELRIGERETAMVQTMHEDIVTAILAGDSLGAAAAMKRHMDSATEQFTSHKGMQAK
ncbi:FadR/GntR family transcriptional regulator [Arenibacterium sp. LLYu02]|uniref:FadR/GntR family transcriptional regulator n=1 Tax=Arenibacterium sp. LLYu02 TaxID=3404132 RepID=UPI003B214449